MKKSKLYFLSKINISFSRMLVNVNAVYKITKKAKILIFLDMVFCVLKYGTGHKEYLIYEYYNLTSKQRDTYLTRIKNNQVVRMLNNKEYYHFFNRKSDFNQKFDKFLKRDWLIMRNTSKEQFEKYMENKEDTMVKPISGSSGVGVNKLKKADFKRVEDMYNHIKGLGDMLIEEVITQHADIDKLNPRSINSLRIVTILKDNKAEILYAYIKIGNSDRPVDNLNANGMCTPLDVDTGKILYAAYDKSKNTFYKHPTTGVELIGYQIPNWTEVVKMVKEAAQVVPEVGYIGWDVAITPTGCCLVEGNHMPGNGMLQMPPHVPDRIGMIPRYREFIEGV